MSLAHRSLLPGVLSLLLVSGCGSSSSSNSYGSAAPTNAGTGGSSSGKPSFSGGGGGIKGANDSVVATPSVAGMVSVAAGAAQTVSITFTSVDGLPITGFAISGSLGSLPAGWSGPSTFSCALVNTGSGCVLNLSYAPTAVDSGTLTLNYLYVDNANMPSTPGTSVTIDYSATTHNNIIAAAAPTGQINTVAGTDNQPVSVNFTTDDGNAATNLTLTTDLSALPSGWSSNATSLSCAIVSTGSGCQLTLIYASAAATRGTLILSYGYTDDSGVPRTAGLNIPYSTASSNNVAAAASPTGQVLAIEKTGGQPVAVTFTTDDGRPASGLYLTSDLTALPPGWSSASNSFSCTSISIGNGCQLALKYAPTALASGTLTLNYAYTNDAGTAETGVLNVAYTATTNDNVVGTASPSGQINAVIGLAGQASQPVSVTFATDDGRPATALQLTSSLTALPPGWSSTDTSFMCSGLDSDNVCQLPLTYAPLADAGGALTLSYTYKNNAGETKPGSLNIAYRATANDNIVETQAPQSLPAILTGSSTNVTLTFTTDDGNVASGLSVTSNLAALPDGWSSTSNGFACSSVSTGTGCQLALTYAPTVATGTSTLQLGFSYANNAGISRTGTATITYSAVIPYP